jgi:hypothetical protein
MILTLQQRSTIHGTLCHEGHLFIGPRTVTNEELLIRPRMRSLRGQGRHIIATISATATEKFNGTWQARELKLAIRLGRYTFIALARCT